MSVAFVLACADRPAPTEPADALFKEDPPSPASFYCVEAGYPSWFRLTEKQLKKLKRVTGNHLTDYVEYSLGKAGGTLLIQSYPEKKNKFAWLFDWISVDTHFLVLYVKGETSESVYSWGRDGSPLNRKKLFDADGEPYLGWRAHTVR